MKLRDRVELRNDWSRGITWAERHKCRRLRLVLYICACLVVSSAVIYNPHLNGHPFSAMDNILVLGPCERRTELRSLCREEFVGMTTGQWNSWFHLDPVHEHSPVGEEILARDRAKVLDLHAVGHAKSIFGGGWLLFPTPVDLEIVAIHSAYPNVWPICALGYGDKVFGFAVGFDHLIKLAAVDHSDPNPYYEKQHLDHEVPVNPLPPWRVIGCVFGIVAVVCGGFIVRCHATSERIVVFGLVLFFSGAIVALWSA
jgi:hypothetical protein